MSGHRLFQDDLASVSISQLRASGVVTSETKSVEIAFGEGNDGLRREVKVVHRGFPKSCVGSLRFTLTSGLSSESFSTNAVACRRRRGLWACRASICAEWWDRGHRWRT